jgi:hypothetical protein
MTRRPGCVSAWGTNPASPSPDAAAADIYLPFQSEGSMNPRPNALPPHLALISTLIEKSLRALKGRGNLSIGGGSLS